jgi:ABC-type microcin C transport system permease subunit YejB
LETLQRLSMNPKSVSIGFVIVFNLFGTSSIPLGVKFAQKDGTDFVLLAYFSLKVDYFSEGNESVEKLSVVL